MTGSLRALVVDDEATIHRLVSLALGREGFSCDAAEDGQAASDMAARRHYDAVVTDLRMPLKDGHTLITELLAVERRPVLVMYTGVTDQQMARDLLARGVDHVAFKPTDVRLLAARVKTLVERRADSAPAAIA